MARPCFVPALMDIYSFILELNFHLAENSNKGSPDIYCSKLLSFSSIHVKIYQKLPKLPWSIKISERRTPQNALTDVKLIKHVKQVKFVNVNSTICCPQQEIKTSCCPIINSEWILADDDFSIEERSGLFPDSGALERNWVSRRVTPSFFPWGFHFRQGLQNFPLYLYYLNYL